MIVLMMVMVMNVQTFAAENSSGTDAENRLSPPRAFNGQGGANTDEKGINMRSKEDKSLIRTIFETYYPEKLDAFEALNASHRQFHDERKLSQKETRREERRLILEEMKDGTLDNSEAFDQLEALKSERQAKGEAIKAILDEKKEALALEKTQNEQMRDALKVLMDAEPKDSDAIKALLDDLLENLNDHLTLDQYYSEQVDEIVNE